MKKSIGFGLFGIVLSIIVYGSIEVVSYVKKQTSTLPDHIVLMKEIAKKHAKGYATEIYDRHGLKIGEISRERRYYLSIDKVPKHVIHAFLSAEDQDFFGHNGVDVSSIFRAAFKNFQKNRVVQGASTITQQLARLLFLSNEKTYSRKIKEVALAINLENRMSKEEILEIYLNKIFLGNHSYGLEAAARNYFDKSTTDLSIGEAALLAGLPKAPSRLAPHRFYRAAMERQRLILLQMHENGFINQKQYDRWIGQHIKIHKHENSRNLAPYFVEEVRKQLENRFEFDELSSQGLKVYTSMDYQVQSLLQASQRLIPQELMSKKNKSSGLQIASIALDLENGGIVAMQGGDSFLNTQFNRVMRMQRPVGKSILPIIVAAAIDNGYTMTTPVDAEQNVSFTVAEIDHPFPSLYQMIVEKDLQQSVILLAALGVEGVVKVLERMGYFAKIHDLRLGLGQEMMSPFNLSKIFASIAVGGKSIQPFYVNRIVDSNEKTVYERKNSQKNSVFQKQETIEIMNFVMSVLMKKDHKFIGEQNIKGFINLNKNNKNAWMLSYNQKLLTLHWVGSERGQTELGANKGEIKNKLRSILKNYSSVYSKKHWADLQIPLNSDLNISYSNFKFKNSAGLIENNTIPFVIGTGPTMNVERKL